MEELSHIDGEGKARMVDVGLKKPQYREARAIGRIALNKETRDLVAENRMKKGEVLAIAEIAGIQAAKKTPELIPLCHPILLTKVDVRVALYEEGAVVTSKISCIGQTGVEMEALTAVSVALLTIYDMCKSVDKNMKIGDIVLLEKTKRDV